MFFHEDGFGDGAGAVFVDVDVCAGVDAGGEECHGQGRQWKEEFLHLATLVGDVALATVFCVNFFLQSAVDIFETLKTVGFVARVVIFFPCVLLASARFP